MNRMLTGGARWAVEQGYGRPCDLDRIEEGGWQTQCLTPFRIERVSATRWAGMVGASSCCVRACIDRDQTEHGREPQTLSLPQAIQRICLHAIGSNHLDRNNSS
jgi:hypothetical protein